MGRKPRECLRVIIEYEGGETKVHEVDGGDVVVVTSGPGTTAHAMLTVSGTAERIAQLLTTVAVKVPAIIRPLLHYLTNDLAILLKGKKAP